MTIDSQCSIISISSSSSSSSPSSSTTPSSTASSSVISSDLDEIPLTEEEAASDLSVPPPPQGLRIIRPSGAPSTAKYLLYDASFHVDFLIWWHKTFYGRDEMHRSVSSGVWSASRKTSDTWKYFMPCARVADGYPSVQCSRCGIVLIHPAVKNTGTSTMSRHLFSKECTRSARTHGHITLPEYISKNQVKEKVLATTPPFTEEQFDDQTLKMIAALRLPFRALESIELRRWARMISSAPRPPTLMAAKTARQRLVSQVQRSREQLLSGMVPGSKISLAVDCWTSPNHYAFMAITGYFIDADWQYREVLLGFEHITGPHTGQNLAQILTMVLKGCGIEDRVLCLTSDNARNNHTMISYLQDALCIIDDTIPKIKHAPCLAHVIQLALGELLGTIRITATNERIINTWKENPEDREKHSGNVTEWDGVPWTLKKLRDLAIYINASPQRREKFASCQTRQNPLALIQDVATRWNSTERMIARARQLRPDLERLSLEAPEFRIDFLDDEEWNQLDYLLEILGPFRLFTDAIGATETGPTIHNVFAIYNELFDHIDRQFEKLQRKRTPWKVKMRQALQNAANKLKDYYSKTYEDLGYLYACATILAPQYKLKTFEGVNWLAEKDEKPWRDVYLDQLTKIYHDYSSELFCSTRASSVPEFSSASVISQTPSSPSSSSPIDASIQSSYAFFSTNVKSKRQNVKSKLDAAIVRHKESRGLQKATAKENWTQLDEYLHDEACYGMEQDDILGRWRAMAGLYPQVASIARDFLAVPAAGVGVERLFNSARDVVSYRRHHLKPATIRLLMMLMCKDRFDLKEEFRVAGIVEDLEDQNEADDDDENMDEDIVRGLISDTEEDGDEDNQENIENDSDPDEIPLPALRRQPRPTEKAQQLSNLRKQRTTSQAQSLPTPTLIRGYSARQKQPSLSRSITRSLHESSSKTLTTRQASLSQQIPEVLIPKRKALEALENVQRKRRPLGVAEGKRRESRLEEIVDILNNTDEENAQEAGIIED